MRGCRVKTLHRCTRLGVDDNDNDKKNKSDSRRTETNEFRLVIRPRFGFFTRYVTV